jgi:Helicase associated domain
MTSSSWDRRLAEYQNNKENGWTSSRTLRSWATVQRQKKAGGTLSDERVEKLDGVGFVWNANPEDQFSVDQDAWNRKFELLKAHHRKNGNCRGPFQDQQLCNWVWAQRSRLKNKESLNEIQQERWARLNAWGFWVVTEHRQSARRGSDATSRDSHAKAASAISNGEMGQCGRQRSGIVVSTTVSVLKYSSHCPLTRPRLTLFSISLAFPSLTAGVRYAL